MDTCDTVLTANFTVNGKDYSAYGAENFLKLSEFIRTKANLTGTKVACSKGACGACIVVISMKDPVTGVPEAKTVPSCLLSVYQCAQANILTTEGIGSERIGYHKVQTQLSLYNGSQCGFCSPGIAMNLYGALEEHSQQSYVRLEESMDGNICRCTGYLSILNGMKSLVDPDVPDIEDLAPQYTISSPIPNFISDAQRYTVNGVYMYKPKSTDELFKIMRSMSGLRYKLALGNTGDALFTPDETIKCLIQLQEVVQLYQYSAVPTSPIVFGSNISLTNVVKMLRSVVEQDLRLKYLREMADFIVTIGNRHVRNISGWAGNLALKHKYQTFHSDIYLILETVGARITVKHYNGLSEDLAAKTVVNTDMTGKVIEKMTIPILAPFHVLKAYKVLPRSSNAPAYVSAAFLFEFDLENEYLVKKRPAIVYQGISGTFCHAVKTETYLDNKNVSDQSVVSKALKLLEEEITPSARPDLASVRYRKSLAKVLFYRFILRVNRRNMLPAFRSGGVPLSRPLSHGVENTTTNESRWPLTRPISKINSVKQFSGETQFVGDRLPLTAQLFGAFVLSSVGNCLLASVDPAPALSLKGVVKFLSAVDIPDDGKNTFNGYDPKSAQQELFCSSKVIYAGQPIGLILATEESIAVRAALQVKVSYKDRKHPVLTIKEAIAHQMICKDDMEKHLTFQALPHEDHGVSGELNIGGQDHSFLEPHSCICNYSDSCLEAWSSTQSVTGVQKAIGVALGIPQNKIVVKAKSVGGAFGGKQTSSQQPAVACALASYLLSTPVQVIVPMATTMQMCGKRLPYHIKYSVNINSSGKLVGAYLMYYNDCGAVYNTHSGKMAVNCTENVYACEIWLLYHSRVRTNLPANHYFRAPGSFQATLAIETIIEHIAYALGKDPLEIRLLNWQPKSPNEKTDFVTDILNFSVRKSELNKRKEKIKQFNRDNIWKKKGIALIPLKYPIIYFGIDFNVQVSISTHDATVIVSHGGIEMGQGINTKVTQACAYALGAPLDKIRISDSSTEPCPNNKGSNGSITSDLCCFAAVKCCKKLRRRLDSLDPDEKDWEALIRRCSAESVDLCARSTYRKDTHPQNYNVRAVSISEVTVDILTGQVLIERVDIFYDCGDSISPQIDIGQIEGGFIQGLGLIFSEKLRYNPETGQNLTHSPWSYHVPMAKDIPVDFRITLMPEQTNEGGVLGTKATGEPPVCLAASVVFAIRNAVEDSRAEINLKKWFMFDLPATPEEVHKFCRSEDEHLVWK